MDFGLQSVLAFSILGVYLVTYGGDCLKVGVRECVREVVRFYSISFVLTLFVERGFLRGVHLGVVFHLDGSASLVLLEGVCLSFGRKDLGALEKMEIVFLWERLEAWCDSYFRVI